MTLVLLQRPGLDSSTHTYADNHLEHQFQEFECCLGCLWAAHTQGEWRECMQNIYTHRINQFKTLYVCYVHSCWQLWLQESLFFILCILWVLHNCDKSYSLSDFCFHSLICYHLPLRTGILNLWTHLGIIGPFYRDHLRPSGNTDTDIMIHHISKITVKKEQQKSFYS